MASLDQTMEEASTALVQMDYLACEALCTKALAQARRHGNWPYYARILLPLQECRRQRRMTAAEGTFRLGTGVMNMDDKARLGTLPAGCVVLTRPASRAEAHAMARQAHADRRFVEVLFADNASSAGHWTIRSFAGPEVSCKVEAPPRVWIDRWLNADETPAVNGRTPGDWFIDATEALGDAALAQAPPATEGIARIEALERCLQVVTDHEIIHQQLAAAARAMAHTHKAAS